MGLKLPNAEEAREAAANAGRVMREAKTAHELAISALNYAVRAEKAVRRNLEDAEKNQAERDAYDATVPCLGDAYIGVYYDRSGVNIDIRNNYDDNEPATITKREDLEKLIAVLTEMKENMP